MNIYAISDLHVSHPQNRRVVEELPAHPSDWLVLAGDVGETPDHLEWTFDLLSKRFANLAWVPGNHELWTLPNDPVQLRGEPRYRYLVEMCRSMGVLSPEDPYPLLDCDGFQFVLAPLFLLYDYTFRPPGVTRQEAMARAFKAGLTCSDEFLLHPDPYSGRAEWCHARVDWTAMRLRQIPEALPLVMVSHFALTRELAHLPLAPEFAIWCGTELTSEWHRLFRARIVIMGHLHTPKAQWKDGTRFEEVSLGYPHEWSRRASPPTLRKIALG